MATDVSRTAVMSKDASKDDEEQSNVRAADDGYTPASGQPKKRQRKNPHHVLHLATLRKPTSMYFHLEFFSPSTSSTDDSIDILTAKRYLTSAFQRFLGLHGAAIPVDILKLHGQDVWIRVPREDAIIVHEALSGWTGDGARWKVKGKDEWLARLAMGGVEGGQDLFRP